MDQTGLAPSDRDAMIRTVLTEAAPDDPMGWAAVASTIRNRMATGNFGSTPAEVVRAPGQFEVWSNGRAQAVTPKHPNYEAAGRIVDAVAAGLPDPTGGATHFYSPGGQAALGRQPPKWGQNPIGNIGGQLFFAPQGRVTFPGSAAIEGATSGKQQVASGDDIFKRWGVNTGDPGKDASTPAKDDSGDVFKRWGVNTAETAVRASEAKKSGSGPVGGDTAAAVGSGIGDLPIVGPYVKEGMIRGAAAIGSVVNPALGLPAPSADQIRQWDAQLRQEHPIAYGAGRTIGAGATLAGGAAAGAGGVLGMAGNMLPRIGYGALSGGTIGAADAYTHGDNPLIGAGLGVAGGAIAPPASAMIGMGVNKLAQGAQYLMPTGVSGVSRPAASIAAQVINADDPAAIQAALAQHGPLAMLADAGPSTNALTAGLALKPSEAKTVVTNALNARAAGKDMRLMADKDAAVGPYQDPLKITDDLKAQRKAQDAANYGAAKATVGPEGVDATSVVAKIDSMLPTAEGGQKTALQTLRARLVDSPAKEAVPAGRSPVLGPDGKVIRYESTPAQEVVPETFKTNPNNLHAIRQELDNVINHGQEGLGVTAGAVNRQNGSLKAARAELDDVLKTQISGWKEADAASQAMAKQIEGVQTGTSILDSGKEAIPPSRFATDYGSASPEVRAAINQGTSSEIGRLLGTKSNDLVALKSILQGEGGWNTEKLATQFGQQPVNNLLGAVGRETAFADTTNKVLQNSATAGRQAAGKLLEETEPGSMNFLPASPTGLAIQAGKKMLFDPLVHLLTASPTAPRNLELARIMTAQGATRDQILQQLLRLNARQQAVSNTGNLLAGITGGTVNPLIAGVAATQRP